MAGKQKKIINTTANTFNENGGAELAPPLVEEDNEVVKVQEEGEAEAPPEPSYDTLMEDNGYVKVLAVKNYTCFGCGDGNYELVRGVPVYVKLEHVEYMRDRAQVIADLPKA